jgi:hypothetical protein
MDTSDNWASNGPVDDSVTETVAASMFKEHLDSSLMQLDHVLDDGQADRRALLKASLKARKKDKRATASAKAGIPAHSPALDFPLSMRDTTPLSYASAPFSPATSSGSRSTPTPSARSNPND